MKKIFKNFIILFVFCLTFTFSGVLNFDISYADTSSSEPVTIGTANDLVKYINSYGKSGHGSPTDHIVLSANIDMSQYYDENLKTTAQFVLTGSIGTSSAPFAGIFDGNGYTISNLKLDVRADMTEPSATVSDNQYAGLFGYTKGATIKNVAFAGNSEIVVGGYKNVDGAKVDAFATNNVYAGTLVGRAENTNISMIQNLATLSFKSTFNSNINFGSLVGSATDSKISYITSNNSASFGNWSLSRADGKVHNLGGLAGNLSNVKANFITLTENFNLQIDSTFIGDLNLGGIAGVVSQGNSQLYNIAVENSYAITNNSITSTDTIVNIGEIAGKLSTPTPLSGNLAYIHFKNNNLSRFGDINGYEYSKKLQENDYITSSLYALNALESSNPNYFSNQVWHPLLGDWDFQNTWYVGGQSIKLQNFYADFVVSFANNSNVFEMTNQDFATSYRYGQKVEMNFAFKTENETNLSDFYEITSINLYSKEVAKIITTITDGKVNYRVSGSDLIEISATEGGFKLVVNKVTLATQGEYSISTTAKTFKANIFSKLFEEEGGEKDGVPGYVYFAEGANTTTETLMLGQMTYGQTYRLRTREKPGSPNLFVGWYLVDESGNMAEDAISTSKTLEIKVGTTPFVGDLQVCAKYLDNAQIVNFILDDGISKIELNSTEIIDKSGQSTSVSKSNSSFKMDIYINDNYEFNVEDFVKTLNTYKSVASNEQFCTLVAEEGEEGKFSFILNMTVLNKDDFGETFEIKAQTTAQETTANVWIWIAVGVGGGVLLIGLIILIIVLVRRNRYGGMGGGSFKSYKKGMYY